MIGINFKDINKKYTFYGNELTTESNAHLRNMKRSIADCIMTSNLLVDYKLELIELVNSITDGVKKE